MAGMLEQTEIGARKLTVQLQLLGARGPDDFDAAFSAMIRDRAEALLVFPSPMLYLEHKRIVDLATRNRLPTIYPWREAVDAGGLISYGANIPDMLRRAAVLVGKILRGAKPADLPVEQPTTFELVLNLKTAKALGLEISPTLVVRADEVIE
jgi:putative ABC transport system substrate-binding protein